MITEVEINNIGIKELSLGFPGYWWLFCRVWSPKGETFSFENLRRNLLKKLSF
jgi:hypothetical protein